MLATGARGEGQLVRQAHRLHRLKRRAETALLALERLGELREDARLIKRGAKFAGTAQRTVLPQHAPGKVDGRGLELARDALIDQPEGARLSRAKLLGVRDHGERCPGTHQARQTLRAARARDDAELHLGQS